MGYFDGLTDAAFKQDQLGNTVFYPWGVIGRGYILTDPAKIDQARLFMRRWYQINIFCATPILTMAIIPRAVPLPVKIALAVTYAVIATGWFVLRSRQLTAAAEISGERMRFRDSYTNAAKGLGRSMLWVLFGVSCLVVVGGLWMAVNGRSRFVSWTGGATAVFFTAVACVYAYMLSVQGRTPPDGR
jgi:hypothetical protein